MSFEVFIVFCANELSAWVVRNNKDITLLQSIKVSEYTRNLIILLFMVLRDIETALIKLGFIVQFY